MRYRHLTIPILVVLTAILAGCATEEAPAGGPGGAVQSFYSALNEGDYGTAKALYGAEAQEIVAGASESGFAKWAETETKRGQIDRVKILSAEETEAAANVEYEVIYADGTTKNGSVTLTFEDGSWKLGVLG